MKQAIEYLLFRSGVSNYQISKDTGLSAVLLSKYATGKSEVGRMTLDNAIKLYDYFKDVLTKLENKYGTVIFDGKEYILIDQAWFSGKQLLEWQTEEGYAHFTAPAVDAEGNEYQVEWVLKTIYNDGTPIEDLGELDWDNPKDVILL